MEQPITVHVPQSVYERIRRAAEQRRRTVADEVAAVVEQAFAGEQPPEAAGVVEQLPHLSDPDLWAAARLRVPAKQATRMQNLVWKEQAEGLTAAEQEEADLLQRYAQQVMLVRAEAAALLHERGRDVSGLIDPAGE
jgi:hypothetical protein